jgi:hypothetical protein
VTVKAQAIKLAWSLLDLGPFDEGGMRNNLTIKFKCWFMDALDIHPFKVIKFTSSRLTRYGFTYFRIMKIKRLSNLHYEIEAQAYNETYMASFETELLPPLTDLPGDLPDGDGEFPPGDFPPTGEPGRRLRRASWNSEALPGRTES